jgi:hypothetical protein
MSQLRSANGVVSYRFEKAARGAGTLAPDSTERWQRRGIEVVAGQRCARVSYEAAGMRGTACKLELPSLAVCPAVAVIEAMDYETFHIGLNRILDRGRTTSLRIGGHGEILRPRSIVPPPG